MGTPPIKASGTLRPLWFLILKEERTLFSDSIWAEISNLKYQTKHVWYSLDQKNLSFIMFQVLLCVGKTFVKKKKKKERKKCSQVTWHLYSIEQYVCNGRYADAQASI